MFINNNANCLFEWSDDVKVFNESIDREHRQLVDIINTIHSYISLKESELLKAKDDEDKQLQNYGKIIKPNNGGKIELIELQNLINELKNYTIYHFKNEEEYMKKEGLYKAYIQKHHSLHLNFRQQIEIMISSMINGKITIKNVQKLLNFLINWLVLHIVGEDKNIMRQVNLIHDGYTPKDAYEIVEKEKSNQSIMVKALWELVVFFQERSYEFSKLHMQAQKEVEKKANKISKIHQDYELLAKSDQLTGIYNRKKAMEVLEDNWKKYELGGSAFSILYFGIDKLKEINSVFGHSSGDSALRAFVDKVVNINIPNSIFCRLGGDEFLMIIENTNEDEAVEIANNILCEVNKISLTNASNQEMWRGSASVGVASVENPEITSSEKLLKEANFYLHKAKKSGKNCVKSSLDFNVVGY